MPTTRSTRRGAPSRSGSRQSARNRSNDEADEADDAEALPTRPTRSARRVEGGNRKVYVVLGLIVVGVIGLSIYRPIMRSVLLGKLDRAQNAAAITAADEYLAFADHAHIDIRNHVIAGNRGPFEAQLHLAAAVKSFQACMDICNR